MRVPAPAPARPVYNEDGTEVEQNVAEEYLDFSNGWVVAGAGYIICAVIVVANSYVLISLVLGNGS